MKIGMDVLDLVALFEGLVVVMGISTGGADGVGIGALGAWGHFFQMSRPNRNRAAAIRIMAAGDVKVQRASMGLIWSNSLNWCQICHCTWSRVTEWPDLCLQC